MIFFLFYNWHRQEQNHCTLYERPPSGRRHGQQWDPWTCLLYGITLQDPFLWHTFPHGLSAWGPAVHKLWAKGTLKSFRQEAVSARAITDCGVPLWFPWTQRPLHLPITAVFAHHVTTFISTPATSAYGGVTQCVHHRPAGRVRTEFCVSQWFQY